MSRPSEFYIDDKGIYSLLSISYPDSIERVDHVVFTDINRKEQFESFMQKVLAEGRVQRSRELFSLLREGQSR